jgi:hypothetical protein
MELPQVTKEEVLALLATKSRDEMFQETTLILQEAFQNLYVSYKYAYERIRAMNSLGTEKAFVVDSATVLMSLEKPMNDLYDFLTKYKEEINTVNNSFYGNRIKEKKAKTPRKRKN